MNPMPGVLRPIRQFCGGECKTNFVASVLSGAIFSSISFLKCGIDLVFCLPMVMGQVVHWEEFDCNYSAYAKEATFPLKEERCYSLRRSPSRTKHQIYAAYQKGYRGRSPRKKRSQQNLFYIHHRKTVLLAFLLIPLALDSWSLVTTECYAPHRTFRT